MVFTQGWYYVLLVDKGNLKKQIQDTNLNNLTHSLATNLSGPLFHKSPQPIILGMCQPSAWGHSEPAPTSAPSIHRMPAIRYSIVDEPQLS
jgi:hypothetical protein